jgi:hypothetical protein
MQRHFLQFFQQSLQQLKAEIEAYPDDRSVWQIAEGTSNSGGTLCYHLLGNLNHFIGHGMGDTGYVRDRPLEFTIRDVPRAELVKWIGETSAMLGQVLPGVDLAAEYSSEFWGEPMTVGQSLLKLLGHLNYHLGQVNYHRRFLAHP